MSNSDRYQKIAHEKEHEAKELYKRFDIPYDMKEFQDFYNFQTPQHYQQYFIRLSGSSKTPPSIK